MDVFDIGRILLSLLTGAVPFAVVAMWGTGIDITKAGSGNPGFNNVLREGFKGRAVFTLAGDVSKGFVALALLSDPRDSVTIFWLLGLAAVVGHCWSPFLKFKGGKGVATTLGVLLFIEPGITAASVILYPLLRMVGRRAGWKQEAAIASLTTMFAISVAVLLFTGVESGMFALSACALIFLRHSSNLRELLVSRKS